MHIKSISRVSQEIQEARVFILTQLCVCSLVQLLIRGIISGKKK